MARALARDGPTFPSGARSCRGGLLADALRLEELPNEPGPRPTVVMGAGLSLLTAFQEFYRRHSEHWLEL